MNIAKLAVSLVLISLATVVVADDADEIRGAFEAYRSAILEGRGDEAAGLLSRSTYDYYDGARRLALTGDEQAVKARILVDQMQVLLLRLRAPLDVLDSSTPPQLIAYAVEQGWIGKESVESIQAGQVRVQGDAATVTAIIGGQDMGPAFRFSREGSWRLDLVPTVQAVNAAIQAAAKESGLSDEAFMVALMSRVVGRELGSEMWQPLRKPAP